MDADGGGYMLTSGAEGRSRACAPIGSRRDHGGDTGTFCPDIKTIVPDLAPLLSSSRQLNLPPSCRLACCWESFPSNRRSGSLSISVTAAMLRWLSFQLAIIGTSYRSCWLIAARTNHLTVTLVTSDTLLRSFWKGCRVQSLGLLQPSGKCSPLPSLVVLFLTPEVQLALAPAQRRRFHAVFTGAPPGPRCLAASVGKGGGGGGGGASRQESRAAPPVLHR